MTSDPGYDQAKDSANRLAPRPISRPPVDPASRREFGRPAGLRGSFVAERVRPKKYREQSEFRPSEQPADPVLQEAFSRPDGSPETLQRHPVDSGALAAEKDGVEPDHADDPWRDPGAPGWRRRRRGPRWATAASWVCATCSSAARCPTWRCWFCC